MHNITNILQGSFERQHSMQFLMLLRWTYQHPKKSPFLAQVILCMLEVVQLSEQVNMYVDSAPYLQQYRMLC